ncbi:MAG: leucyl aminopeptidase, partial [Candidatus Margulisiibacteriota bacterium]
MKIAFDSGEITKIKCGALAIGVFEGAVKPAGTAAQIDKALGGLIGSLISKKEISGKEKTLTVIHTQNKISPERVMVIGLGKRDEFDADKARAAASAAINEAKKIKAETFSAALNSFCISKASAETILKALIEGIYIGEYEFEGYKSKDDEKRTNIQQITIADSDVKDIKAYTGIAKDTSVVCEAVNKTRDLVNHPSNKLTPSIFEKFAKEVSVDAGLEIEVLGPKEMQKAGMGGILAVAKGSTEEPRVITLKYFGNKKSKEITALIGKGITFDSGGISLKPSNKMEEMKHDMAGAAVVLYAIKAAAELKLKKNVIAVMPLTENMPDGAALKPGDVISTMEGKTLEIISTDAEGRMILADAITYAKKLGATKLIDIATLTGACISALGDVATGIMGNDQRFVDEVIEAGKVSGE